MTSLSISCVIYDTDADVFTTTIKTLASAIFHCTNGATDFYASLYLIDNTDDKKNLALLEQVKAEFAESFQEITILAGQGNVGYGKGNNLAIQDTTTDFHLIVNPDVQVHENAIDVGINYLNIYPDVGLVAPHATNAKGEIEFLAKRKPSFVTIFLRGLDNAKLNLIFKKSLEHYCYKDKIPSSQPIEIELASGCFMLCRTDILKLVGGFSSDYFLYFEDFDLSLKIKKYKRLLFLPDMHIVHAGGNAGKKGRTHTKLFLTSFLKFKLKQLSYKY